MFPVMAVRWAVTGMTCSPSIRTGSPVSKTSVAGSSRYFERGVMVYSNEAKQALLGVPEAVLMRMPR